MEVGRMTPRNSGNSGNKLTRETKDLKKKLQRSLRKSEPDGMRQSKQNWQDDNNNNNKIRDAHKFNMNEIEENIRNGVLYRN